MQIFLKRKIKTSQNVSNVFRKLKIVIFFFIDKNVYFLCCKESSNFSLQIFKFVLIHIIFIVRYDLNSHFTPIPAFSSPLLHRAVVSERSQQRIQIQLNMLSNIIRLWCLQCPTTRRELSPSLRLGTNFTSCNNGPLKALFFNTSGIKMTCTTITLGYFLFYWPCVVIYYLSRTRLFFDTSCIKDTIIEWKYIVYGSVQQKRATERA